MHIALITKERYFELYLPDTVSGKYWIVDEKKDIDNNRLLGVEPSPDGEKWMVRSTDSAQFEFSNAQEEDRIVLDNGVLYPIRLGDNREHSFLLTDNLEEGNEEYQKYRVRGDVIFSVGKGADCDIVYHNSYVSSLHASLIYQNNTWRIQDNESKNGVYVNKQRINGVYTLNCGDIIYIFGLKIVIGSDFFGINDLGNRVEIRNEFFSPYPVSKDYEQSAWKEKKENYYYRSPSFQREIDKFEMKVDMPPEKDRMDDTPILLTLMPAMLMGVASFSSGIVTTVNTINNGGKIITSIPTLVMSVSMLTGMVLFPFLMKRRDKKNRKNKEQTRREKYHKYLQEIKREIAKGIMLQEEILRENEPNIVELTSMEDFWRRKLWYRTPQHNNFLEVRLGVGNVAMCSNIKFPEERFTIDDDYLKKDLFDFQNEERLLKNVPICISLKDERVIGIVGGENRLLLLNNIISQLVALHSYNEVKIVFITEARDLEKMSAVRFSHHIWDDEEKNRFYASSEENARELSVYMNRIIGEESQGENQGKSPHYIIISTSKLLEKKCAFFDEVLSDSELANFSVIAAYEELKDLPKECNSVIELNGQMGILSQRNAASEVAFIQDIVTDSQLKWIIYKTSEYKLDLQKGKYNLPACISFMDLYKVGKSEYLNIRERWKNNNPVLSLQAPVGVDTNGEIFYLDLHEKFHGPHGLIAGMTGSGKSEFIITYILSLAINYHPNEVAFVLIDYKGGGLVGAFENEHYRLPHLAGTITNLDVSAINRSILSIKSELKRRQNMFNVARDIANEGTMDIYKYQKMYRNGQVTEPLPHLFIISDEFAELKSQQPEFLEQLISTARIGRSLGVHLILATQKPSGVVNEQIWANSKFKVCLKVQDKPDSMDMLKRPDAASLVETGRFYLQVGYNELFELGQSAWCGAPYTDSEETVQTLDDSIEMIDNLGNSIEKIKPKKEEVSKDNGKQIVRIMEHLTDIAHTDCISERQLWLPQIPIDITLDEILQKYPEKEEKRFRLSCVVGELDDPYTQSQHALDIDFTRDGNLIIYGSAGSGKELTLNTMLISLYKKYNASELNVYAVDYGAESLVAFKKAPQTGHVFLSGDGDQIRLLFTLIEKKIRERKKLLASEGVSYVEYNASSDEKLPAIVFMINNYSAFIEENEWAEKHLISLTRECSKYGIYTVLTVASAGAIRMLLSQNFGRIFCMQMNDKSDYISILGNTQGVFPLPAYGRGILRQGKYYEYQIALPCKETAGQKQYILNLCLELSEKDLARAERIPSVPKNIDLNEVLEKKTDLSAFPLGLIFATGQPAVWDFTQNEIMNVSYANERPAAGVICALGKIFAETLKGDVIYLNVHDEIKNYSKYPYSNIDTDKMEEKIVELFNMCVGRNNRYKTNQSQDEDRIHKLIVVQSPMSIKDHVSDDVWDKFETMLNKAESFWNVFFIIADHFNGKSYSLESWYTSKCAPVGGLWIGDGFGQQIRLTASEADRDMNVQTEINSGFYIQGRKALYTRYNSVLINEGGED